MLKLNCISKEVILLLVFISLFGFYCGHDGSNHGTLKIALMNDIDSFNPITSDDVSSASIQSLLFPALTSVKWIDSLAVIQYEPLAVTRWEISPNNKHVTFYIKQNQYWDDNTKITVDDIIYTYRIYSDPLSAAPHGYLFELIEGFEKINDSTLSITYSEFTNDPLAFSSLPFVPDNYFSSDIQKLREDMRGYKPVTAGPYKLEKWETNNQIILTRNENYTLAPKPLIKKIVFKILPDYVSRLTALKTGEIDFMAGIRPEDADNLKSSSNIGIIDLKAANYEFVCWSNIDGWYYNTTGKTRPHQLFGNKNVRKALTMAIDRNEIMRTCLGAYGQECSGSISPVFKNEYNFELKAIPYDHIAAAAILASEGWIDRNRNGMLDKDGVEFSFTLFINSGNPRREYAANMIKNYLQKIGIQVQIEKLEWNTFETKVMNREFDAFIRGLSASVNLDQYSLWYSDLSKSQMNDAGFQNKKADFLIDNIYISSREDAIPLFKEFQKIIHEEQPCTFLYWYSNVIGYNKNIKGINPNILDFYNDISVWQRE